MPVAAIGGLGAIGDIVGGIFGSNAASDAASQQSEAAKYAADKQYQASQDALAFEKQQYANSQAQLAPWLQTGSQSLSNLNWLLGQTQAPSQSTTSPGASGVSVAATPNTGIGGYGSLLQPYSKTFSAPTAQDLSNDPGYQARLNLGTQALQQSAAARGNLLTGGTSQALNRYAQDYASNEYNNMYNRAYNTYASNYNQYENDQANKYNRLASLAGAGQTTANNLATLGQNTANSVSNNLLSTANAMGQYAQNAAAANASGIIGSANAWNGALSGGVNSLQNIYLLQQLLGKKGAYGAGSAYSQPGGVYGQFQDED